MLAWSLAGKETSTGNRGGPLGSSLPLFSNSSEQRDVQDGLAGRTLARSVCVDWDNEQGRSVITQPHPEVMGFKSDY